MSRVKPSAGLLPFRRTGDDVEVLLVHPGGPYWAKKDAGSWSIPKGEYEPGEDPLAAARREYTEETGFVADGDFIELEPLKQKSGKVVSAWAIETDCDASAACSNTFSLEWPPKSGKRQDFPEVDRAEWFAVAAARAKIMPGQVGFIDQLARLLRAVLVALIALPACDDGPPMVPGVYRMTHVNDEPIPAVIQDSAGTGLMIRLIGGHAHLDASGEFTYQEQEEMTHALGVDSPLVLLYGRWELDGTHLILDSRLMARPSVRTATYERAGVFTLEGANGYVRRFEHQPGEQE